MFAQAGERISDYEILKLLGRGSFGVVPLGVNLFLSFSRCTAHPVSLSSMFSRGQKQTKAVSQGLAMARASQLQGSSGWFITWTDVNIRGDTN